MPGLPQHTKEFFVVSPADPYALDWVRLRNLYRGQSDEYETDFVQGPTWWNFTVTVLGEIYFVDPDFPTDAELQQLQQQSLNAQGHHSMLKVEVEYLLGNGKARRVRFDIGAGIDIFIPPTNRLWAWLIGPDPDSAPDFRPPSFIENLNVASTVLVTARCVGEPLSRPIAKYTQLVAGAAQGPEPVGVPIVEGATRVQAIANNTINPLDVRQRQLIVDGDGTVLGAYFVGDVSPIFIGATQTNETQISGFANSFLVSSANEDPTIISLMQLLEF